MNHLHSLAFIYAICNQFQIKGIALHRIKSLGILFLDIFSYGRDLFRRNDQNDLVPLLRTFLLRIGFAAVLSLVHIAALCHSFDGFITPANYPVIIRLYQHSSNLRKTLQQRKNKFFYMKRKLRLKQNFPCCRGIDVSPVDGNNWCIHLNLWQNFSQGTFGSAGTQSKGSAQLLKVCNGIKIFLWHFAQLGQRTINIRDQKKVMKDRIIHRNRPPLLVLVSLKIR